MPTALGPRASRLREMSRRLVLAELAGSQPLSQADVVRRTGLSRATVASVVTELADQGRLAVGSIDELGGTPPVGRGRPPRLLRLQTGPGVVAALDLGHSHLATAVADLSGTILAEDRIPMNIDASAQASIDAAHRQLFGLLERIDQQRDGGGAGHHGSAAHPLRPLEIVVGVPGPIDGGSGQLRSGTILPGWVGVPAAEEFDRRFGQPVTLENDANLGAVGETTYGRARGVENVLYVKVSTGIGAGMILGGRLYRGSSGTAGEIGHVQVSEDGAICRCGSRGCLETLSSAEAAVALLRQSHGPDLTIDDAVAIVRRGDPGGVRLFTDMGTEIGRVVAAMCANIDPSMVVVGGPLVDDPGPLLEGIAAAVRRYTQPYVSAQLVVAGGELGQRAGLLGAIAMATELANAP